LEEEEEEEELINNVILFIRSLWGSNIGYTNLSYIFPEGYLFCFEFDIVEL
jgi:hypothetical protein